MSPAAEKTVTVRRTLRGTRAFLFSAWTDRALFAQWFGPKGWSVEACTLDCRVGGAWQARFRRGDGSRVAVRGTYLEIAPPDRLVFTWEADPTGPASVVTVAFADAPGGVEIAITHRKLGTAQAVDMDAGWNNTLDALETFAAGARADPVAIGSDRALRRGEGTT
ncbi:SRPBCC family protein [Aquabacter spiritensis]|uniref:Uncharacterized protein YndB with AHSA1/START domain n=1 Tax=Aquabacter spiritensis TaxID=933073 RepID=A0A4R3LUD8_9HYPH|nr:SRPBCC domain-containing protein [Aquabacter spiritensis]TCT02275.1 uncharacterized protein YndB with AHSA1/START domain [Aquabacter spiritensis]